jgi:hypothetical protein
MTRRRASGNAMNLDSLLDTLTNVVGVLVLMLMVVSLNVREAVERILDINPEQLGISAADLAAAQRQAADVAQQLASLKTKADSQQAETDRRELRSLAEQVQKLQQVPKPEPIPPEKAEELRNQNATAAKKVSDLSTEVTQLEEELQRLKGQLDATPAVAVPPPKTVPLPNPREAPKDAKPVQVICRDGRTAVFDPDELQASAKKRVAYLLRPMQVKAGPNGEIDCQKLVDQFHKSGNVTSGPYRARLSVENFQLMLTYELRGTSGETAAQVVARNSDLRRLLRRVDPQKYYVQFLVWSDSFDAYVAARSVCDELNLAAGWIPLNADHQWKTGLGIAVVCQGKPKPPPPPPTPPPNPNQPPAPTTPPPPLPNDVVD